MHDKIKTYQNMPRVSRFFLHIKIYSESAGDELYLLCYTAVLQYLHTIKLRESACQYCPKSDSVFSLNVFQIIPVITE